MHVCDKPLDYRKIIKKKTYFPALGLVYVGLAGIMQCSKQQLYQTWWRSVNTQDQERACATVLWGLDSLL